jgi:cobalt-zinc-cadmium efflux system protein
MSENEHTHHHHHEHTHKIDGLNRAFIAGIVLNLLFVIVEVVAGIATNSLALLSDAGHNLGDVAGLAMALVAYRLTKVKSNKKYTYGYSKTTILVALLNAMILLIAIGGIGYEAVQRLFSPQPMQGKLMVIVAAAGIVINTISALLFLNNKENDLNVRGAFLHLAADALVSLAVVVAGLVIMYTDWYWMDSAVSLLIFLVILVSTWRLVLDSLRLSLDGVPANIDMEKLQQHLLSVSGVRSVHHVHVWALSTTVNALTAHLVIDEILSSDQEQELKEEVKESLEQLHIQHATLETERGKVCCTEEEC